MSSISTEDDSSRERFIIIGLVVALAAKGFIEALADGGKEALAAEGFCESLAALGFTDILDADGFADGFADGLVDVDTLAAVVSKVEAMSSISWEGLMKDISDSCESIAAG